jgi:DNA-directed RNA polymerase specialized sigma subunit
MTRDKKRYIEALFYNYKKNKARLQILELGLISDEDFILGSIDYSKDKIQTSNLSNLDNQIIAREKEMERLKKDIKLTEILLNSLNERDKLVISKFYIENISNIKIAEMIDRVDLKTVWRIKDIAIRNMASLI